VLDEDIRHLEMNLLQLDVLRGLLIKRDDAALDRLLGEIRGRTEAYAANERARQMLRAELAPMLGCDTGRFTLSKLQSMLPEPQRAAVASRRDRLTSLIADLKREYTLTSLLVSDCARFNRTLMRTFFGTGSQAGVTYDPSGGARHQTSATLMSLKL
jgi:hypothetical protein